MDFAVVLFVVILGTILFAALVSVVRHSSRTDRPHRNFRDDEWYSQALATPRSAAGTGGTPAR